MKTTSITTPLISTIRPVVPEVICFARGTSSGVPVNTAEDDPAPATADLDQIDIAFDPQDGRRVYLLRVTTTPERAWLYKSDDYGLSFSNTQIGV